jgi:hypothetical protein
MQKYWTGLASGSTRGEMEEASGEWREAGAEPFPIG